MVDGERATIGGTGRSKPRSVASVA
jgi:hypothetical protein